jgi:hypothetical protein
MRHASLPMRSDGIGAGYRACSGKVGAGFPADDHLDLEDFAALPQALAGRRFSCVLTLMPGRNRA